MGTDPRRSVVDSHGRAHDVPNLYIVAVHLCDGGRRESDLDDPGSRTPRCRSHQATRGDRVTRQFFTSAQRELLRHVLDRLVPAGHGFPAAGDLGIAAYLEEVVGARAGMRRLLLDGLRRIALVGERRHPDGFAVLAGDEQDSVLGVVEREDPEFFEVLVGETYSGY